MRKWLLTGLLLVSGVAAWAITGSLTGSEVTVSYEEPSTNSDGTPLTDLKETTVYYDLGAGPVVGKVTTAQPSGGATVTATFVVPVNVGAEANVSLWATATDTAGNESDRSNAIAVRIDRLAPAAPK